MGLPIKSSFKEFFENGIKDEVIDYKNPTCNNCSDCCSMGAMLLPEEFKKIKRYLRTKEGSNIYKKAKKLISYHKEQGTIYWLCPFISSKKRCLIYSFRPKICQDFHCSKELAKDYDKKDYETVEHYTIWDLFK